MAKKLEITAVVLFSLSMVWAFLLARPAPAQEVQTDAGSGQVSSDSEIVWEYISPYFRRDTVETSTNPVETNLVYRAYRVPYDWVPQLTRPLERPVVPPDRSDFRIEPQ